MIAENQTPSTQVAPVIEYKNPIPVAVAIIPVQTEVEYTISGLTLEVSVHLAVYGRRNIQPKLGMLALPGGFVNEMERLETGGAREVKEETGLIITEDDFQLFRSEVTPNNRNLIFGITPTRTMDVLQQLEENWKNTPQIREETQGFVIAGLNIPDAAFPLHQKALGKYLDKVNGAMIKEIATNSILDFSDQDVQELISKMKADGYISEEFQYAPKATVKNKV